MKKMFFSTFLLLFALTPSGFASEISRITLAELYEKADLIVMAGVTRVDRAGERDEVTIQVESFLKGNSPDRKYTFTLVSRGGVKDFDPVMKKGDTGVFFLKQMRKGVEKAYWGSVAVFVKNNFNLSAGETRTKASGPLAAWRDYRIKLGQAQNIAEYERGFLKAYNSPDLLEEGPPDFRLGLSDGKLARKGIVPSW